jgi:hypothetical protein
MALSGNAFRPFAIGAAIIWGIGLCLLLRGVKSAGLACMLIGCALLIVHLLHYVGSDDERDTGSR